LRPLSGTPERIGNVSPIQPRPAWKGAVTVLFLCRLKLNNAAFISQADSGTLAGAWVPNTSTMSFGNSVGDSDQWTGTIHKVGSVWSTDGRLVADERDCDHSLVRIVQQGSKLVVLGCALQHGQQLCAALYR